MKIAIGNDHAAVELTEEITEYLESLGHQVTNFGAAAGEKCDYPAVGKEVGEVVASGEFDCGVLICGTGVGISIAANKVKGIRCGLCTSVEMAHLTKQHNNANILALGGRTTEPELALKIVDEWLDTEFEGGRHQRRVDMLDRM